MPIKLKFLMPGEIAVSKAEYEKLKVQHAEVQAVMGVDVAEELERRFRKGYTDVRATYEDQSYADHNASFYDGMRFVLEKITRLRDKYKKEESPF